MAAIVRRVDDKDFAEGIETESEVTVPLQLGTAMCELDLTKEHFEQLRADLAPWFKIAHSAGLKQSSHPGASIRVQNRVYNARMRAWADQHGMSYRQPGSGKVQYTRKLKRQFTEWEAEHGQFVPPGR